MIFFVILITLNKYFKVLVKINIFKNIVMILSPKKLNLVYSVNASNGAIIVTEDKYDVNVYKKYKNIKCPLVLVDC